MCYFREQQANGSWLGYVRPLQERTADLAGLTLGITYDRMAYFDYLSHTIPLSNTIILARPTSDGGAMKPDWTIFKSSFSNQIWSLVPMMLLLSTLTLRAIRSNSSSIKTSPWQDYARPYLYFLQRDGMFEESDMISERIPVFMTRVFGYILFVSYCALLTASRSTGSSMVDLSDFGKILSQEYQLLVSKGTINEQALMLAVPGSSMHQIYTQTVRDNPYALVNSVAEAKEKMLANPKAVFLGYGSSFQSDNRFAVVSGFKESMVMWGSFVLPKDSEFTDLFGFHMNHVHEVGLDELAERKWLKTKGMEDSLEASKPEALGFETVGFPFACLAAGLMLSAFISMVEWVKMVGLKLNTF